MKEKRTPQEICRAVENAVCDVNKVLDVIPLFKGRRFFNEKRFYEEGFDIVIKNICKKYKVDHEHVRKVACID